MLKTFFSLLLFKMTVSIARGENLDLVKFKHKKAGNGIWDRDLFLFSDDLFSSEHYTFFSFLSPILQQNGKKWPWLFCILVFFLQNILSMKEDFKSKMEFMFCWESSQKTNNGIFATFSFVILARRQCTTNNWKKITIYFSHRSFRCNNISQTIC